MKRTIQVTTLFTFAIVLVETGGNNPIAASTKDNKMISKNSHNELSLYNNELSYDNINNLSRVSTDSIGSIQAPITGLVKNLRGKVEETVSIPCGEESSIRSKRSGIFSCLYCKAMIAIQGSALDHYSDEEKKQACRRGGYCD